MCRPQRILTRVKQGTPLDAPGTPSSRDLGVPGSTGELLAQAAGISPATINPQFRRPDLSGGYGLGARLVSAPSAQPTTATAYEWAARGPDRNHANTKQATPTSTAAMPCLT